MARTLPGKRGGRSFPVGLFRWPFYERRHAAIEAERDQGVEEPKRRGGNSGRSLILVSQSASTKRRLGLQRPRDYLRASRPLFPAQANFCT